MERTIEEHETISTCEMAHSPMFQQATMSTVRLTRIIMPGGTKIAAIGFGWSEHENNSRKTFGRQRDGV
ncbi:hypothetical protein I41_49630 [Lacipirellula limnantheis]|uniref:Uncharacterized protein n=1 Tax=Lacipirellula limnantheis TaxID=2528024 RepID=A0A517U507_9BACT|nr:hypothetical protein I41_49630 [Lacipirellula limnantheis]